MSTSNLISNSGISSGTDLSVHSISASGAGTFTDRLDVRSGIGFYKSGTNDITNVLYSGGPEDILIHRNFDNIASLLNIRSKAGTIGIDLREATLALTNGDDGANEEFVDIYNNNYSTGTYPDISYGIRLQKRGTGQYRQFRISYSTGIDNVIDALTIDPDLKVSTHWGRIVSCTTGTSDPVIAGLGDEVYRSDLGKWKKFNGTTWDLIN